MSFVIFILFKRFWHNNQQKYVLMIHFSLSTFSNLSYISHNQINDVTMRQSTFECCRCQCHHYINNNLVRSETNSYSYVP